MKRTPRQNSILVCALLGVMVAGQAMAADIRYQNSGDYFDTVAVTGVNGWQAGAGGPGGLPGTNDTARANWGNNTITLAGEAPLLMRFQLGVDESGKLIVNAGGKLKTTGTANSTVGNNGNTARSIQEPASWEKIITGITAERRAAKPPRKSALP